MISNKNTYINILCCPEVREIFSFILLNIFINGILYLVQIKILVLLTEKSFTKILVACGSVLGGTQRDIIDSPSKESKKREF